MDFILNNLDGLFGVLLALHYLAAAVTNLTPTPKDDEFVAKAYRVIEVLGGIVTVKAKMK